MDYEKMNFNSVMITGGAGFIGSNLVEYLINTAERIIIVDNLSTGRLENIKELIQNDHVQFEAIDITNYEKLKNLFKEFSLQFIFHQAALPSVQRSFQNPIATNKANIEGTMNIFELSHKYNVEKVVYASSSSVYGDTEVLPKTESMKPNPLSPYAVSKIATEYYGKVFNNNEMVRTTGLRYFNIFGPNQNPDSQYSAVIPIFTKAALNNEPLVINGDGEQTRDFTYIENACIANILSAVSKKSDGYVLNVGCGQRITINHLAEKIIEITNSKSEIQHIEPRIGDVRHSLADIDLCQKLIGYSPSVSLEEGLENTINYYIKINE